MTSSCIVAGITSDRILWSERVGKGKRPMSFQLSGSAPEIYENSMVPLWFGRWAGALLTFVSLKTGETVLDVACGTGVTTRIAKREVGSDGRVTGLDINAGMLA